ncbi:restriction endonuclease subunit S [Gemella morbillorum]|uniref:restriction endonuclease subunit S n=1 Tax=Gemella morbillorum TaxID=29391 RepID=UPI00319DEF39
MTNILELLKNEKVEWQKLKDILISINTGLNPRKNFVLNDRGRILTSWYITTKDYSQNEKIEFIEGKTAKITEEARKIINQRSKLEKGDLLFSAVGTVGKVALVEIEPDNFDVNESTFILKPNNSIVDSKYLMYYLRGNTFQNILSSNLKGSTLSGIRKGDLECFEIPIPSPETQEKIVEILDKLTNYVTELQSELQSELQLRTKQYTYYRDKLLSEDYLNKITKEMEEDRRLRVEKLKNICEFKRGKRLVKNELQEEGDFPVYQNSITPLGYYHEKNFDKDTTFIISAGAAGEIVYSDRDFWAADDVYVLLTREDIMSRYLYYCLMSKQYIIKSKVRKASIPRLSKDDIEKIIIPLPSLSLQNKIVKILDKFQILLADTKGLLPEEIEQRQKQYEYYREKLLTFDVECDSTHARTHARTHIISNLYYEILQKAARIVEVDIEDKVEWKRISDFCKRQKGINITAKQMKELTTEDGDVKVFAGGNTVAYLYQEIVGRENIVDKPSVIVKSRGTIDFEYFDKMFTHKNEMWSYSISDKNNIKYLYYYMKTNIEYFRSRAISGKLPQISTGVTDNYKIPLPPLHVQQHIVNILDKFDTLVNNIKEGLPKEIEQRQKQYEYWREQLLNFNLE